MKFAAALLIAAVGYAAVGESSAAKKKISRKRTDFTEAQREKILEEARKICKRRYGAGATVYRLDYYTWSVTCLEG